VSSRKIEANLLQRSVLFPKKGGHHLVPHDESSLGGGLVPILATQPDGGVMPIPRGEGLWWLATAETSQPVAVINYACANYACTTHAAGEREGLVGRPPPGT